MSYVEQNNYEVSKPFDLCLKKKLNMIINFPWLKKKKRKEKREGGGTRKWCHFRMRFPSRFTSLGPHINFFPNLWKRDNFIIFFYVLFVDKVNLKLSFIQRYNLYPCASYLLRVCFQKYSHLCSLKSISRASFIHIIERRWGSRSN